MRIRKEICRYCLFSVLILSMLCSCFPASYVYWAPSASDGKLSYSATGTASIAPSNTIEFEFNSVRLQLSGNGNEVDASLFNPKGNTLAFSAGHAVLHDIQILKSTNVLLDISWVDSASLKRQFSKAVVGLTGDQYSIEIKFDGPEIVHYRIQLPSIKVDGQTFEIPEIEFIKKEGFGVFGF